MAALLELWTDQFIRWHEKCRSCAIASNFYVSTTKAWWWILHCQQRANGFTSPYNYMHNCLDCNFFSALIFGKHLATASLLRTTSIASKLNTADSMLWPHLEVMFGGSRCNHVVLIFVGTTKLPSSMEEPMQQLWKKACVTVKKVVQRSIAFLQRLDLQQLHIPWDPGGLSVWEQTATWGHRTASVYCYVCIRIRCSWTTQVYALHSDTGMMFRPHKLMLIAT